MGPSGHAPAFIFTAFDMVDGSVQVSRALICSRMLAVKNTSRDLFDMSRETEMSVRKPVGNQAPYLKPSKIQHQETRH